MTIDLADPLALDLGLATVREAAAPGFARYLGEGVDLALPQIGGGARKTNHDYTHGKLPELVDIMIEEGASMRGSRDMRRYSIFVFFFFLFSALLVRFSSAPVIGCVCCFCVCLFVCLLHCFCLPIFCFVF